MTYWFVQTSYCCGTGTHSVTMTSFWTVTCEATFVTTSRATSTGFITVTCCLTVDHLASLTTTSWSTQVATIAGAAGVSHGAAGPDPQPLQSEPWP